MGREKRHILNGLQMSAFLFPFLIFEMSLNREDFAISFSSGVFYAAWKLQETESLCNLNLNRTGRWLLLLKGVNFIYVVARYTLSSYRIACPYQLLHMALITLAIELKTTLKTISTSQDDTDSRKRSSRNLQEHSNSINLNMRTMVNETILREDKQKAPPQSTGNLQISHQIIDSLQEGIAIITFPEKKLKFFNQSIFQMLGCKQNEEELTNALLKIQLTQTIQNSSHQVSYDSIHFLLSYSKILNQYDQPKENQASNQIAN